MSGDNQEPRIDPTVAALFTVRPWHVERSIQDPPPVGFLWEGEGHLLYALARDVFDGEHGALVDCGSFLGRSAFYFARGLRENRVAPDAQKRIHCYDDFAIHGEFTRRQLETNYGRPFEIHHSTRPLFDANTIEFAELLEVHEADFHRVAWDRGPVDILFVDIAKSPALQGCVVDCFFEHLIPGRSVVIQQDYHHVPLPHVNVLMEYLHEYFAIVEPRIDDSCVFLNTARIPEAVTRKAKDYAFTLDEQIALIEGAIARLPEHCRHIVALCRALLVGAKSGRAAMKQAIQAAGAYRAKMDPHWKLHEDVANARLANTARRPGR